MAINLILTGFGLRLYKVTREVYDDYEEKKELASPCHPLSGANHHGELSSG